MSWWTLCWLSVLLLVSLGTAADVPFVFGDGTSGIAGYTSAHIEQASSSSPDLAGVPAVSSPSDNEVLAFPVTGGGNTSEGSAKEKVGDLLKAFDERTDTNNQYVLDEAALLAAKYPGDLTMDQICSIYTYLKNGDGAKKGWSYVRDRRGPDYYRYANESLKMGDRAGCSGVGDCDDFAILMSSLIESIGGTTRIILAHNNTTGGHAYAEVYLGNLNVQNNQVEGIANWLKQKFNTDKIYTHIDTETKDVWLNMDWGLDEKGIAHPGGPFFQGDKHIVLYIRDLYGKTVLKLPITEPKPIPPAQANQPPVIDSFVPDKPSPQYAGAIVTWTAAASDPENDPLVYKFFLKSPATGGQLAEKTGWITDNTWTWTTTAADAGQNQVEVWVRDNKHAGPDSKDDSSDASVTVTKPNEKPTISGLSPDKANAETGSTVTWTAAATDPENDPLVYKYFLKGPATGGQLAEKTGWISYNIWTWTTTPADVGQNQVEVWVRDGNHAGTEGFDANLVVTYELTQPAPKPEIKTAPVLPVQAPTNITPAENAIPAPAVVNKPPVVNSLTPDKTSPQYAGTVVAWTATASDPENDPLVYKFFLRGPTTRDLPAEKTGWISHNTWTWTTTSDDVGNNQVWVWVRDEIHDSPDGSDSNKAESFTIAIKQSAAPVNITRVTQDSTTISVNQPPVINSSVPDEPSPQSGGLPVRWTAAASDPDGDAILYRFWLKGPSTGNNWKVVQDWSNNNTWVWSTSPANAGNFTVYVYARDGKHAGPNGYDRALGTTFTVLQSN